MKYDNDDPYYMGNRDTLPTKLIFKTNYAVIEEELPWDVGADDMVRAIYGIMVGLGYVETGILHAMKEFAEDKLDYLEPQTKTESEDDDVTE